MGACTFFSFFRSFFSLCLRFLSFRRLRRLSSESLEELLLLELEIERDRRLPSFERCRCLLGDRE